MQMVENSVLWIAFGHEEMAVERNFVFMVPGCRSELPDSLHVCVARVYNSARCYQRLRLHASIWIVLLFIWRRIFSSSRCWWESMNTMSGLLYQTCNFTNQQQLHMPLGSEPWLQDHKTSFPTDIPSEDTILGYVSRVHSHHLLNFGYVLAWLSIGELVRLLASNSL